MKLVVKSLIVGVITFTLIGCSEMSNEPTNIDNENFESLGKVTKSEAMNSAEKGATIYDVASTNPDFSILAAAVDAAGFDGLLDGNRQLTVFAPTNTAFETLLGELELSAEELLGNTELLKTVLAYHVSPGNKKARNVLSSGRVNTLQGTFIFSKIENDMPMVGNDANGYATILTPNLRVANGTIHVIDAVLLP